MMEEEKKAGRPRTLTADGRKEQFRAGTAANREKAKKAGKVRLEASCLAESKSKLERFRDERGLANLGEALDAIMATIYVDR